MPRHALPPTRTGPEQRRRRRRLAWAGLLMGFAAAALASGWTLGDGPSGRLVATPARVAVLAGLLLAGALLALRVGRLGRALAGGGFLLGRAMGGAGLAVVLDAAALLQWDRGLFGLGLALVGAWLASGAAAPVDLPPATRRGRTAAPARGRARRRGRGVS